MAGAGLSVAGLVMAGGLASRMGECKVLLPVGGKTTLELIVTRMREAGVSEIVVVTGMYEEKVREEVLRLGCRPAHNSDFRTGMFSSVRIGVEAMNPGSSAFFFLPGDIPLVKPASYRALIDAFAEGKTLEVVYPTFKGERSHPPLIDGNLKRSILEWNGGGGLRALLENMRHAMCEVPTADRGTTLDMDTPDDYRALLAYAEREPFPDDEECGELLLIAGTPECVKRHSRRVANVAGHISAALRDAGVNLNDRLLRASCLLHDIARAQERHESEGAVLLSARGYHEVADAVAAHMDMQAEKPSPEAKILYLADKLTAGESLTTLEDRAALALSRFAGDDGALGGVHRKIERAFSIQRYVEKTTGRAIGEILADIEAPA